MREGGHKPCPYKRNPLVYDIAAEDDKKQPQVSLRPQLSIIQYSLKCLSHFLICP